MRPHPKFVGWKIARDVRLGGVTLKALSVEDVERDYAAIMESASDLKRAKPKLSWPDGLTLEENLVDVAWHQKEFESNRSFAWVIEDPKGQYVGCLYIYPSVAGEDVAEVYWWWRTGASTDESGFRKSLLDWVSSGDWPDLDYQFKS